ncbi:MAG TPA: hypothetical protein DDY43_14350 [Synechococcales bacterium UBA10510]|jgi:hypothetical protein|nr:hypothetical protein [Synechococcales bacterium UBA10510]
MASKKHLPRKLHRSLVPIAVVPLLLTSLSGSLYGALISADIEVPWLLRLHTGNFGLLNLQPYYSTVLGILTVFIAVSGVAMMVGGRRPKDSPSA